MEAFASPPIAEPSTAERKTAPAVRVWLASYPVDLHAVLGVFVRGRRDPAAMADSGGGFWLTARTPDGPATLHLTSERDRVQARVRAEAWGPGAQWSLDQVPALLGDEDDPTGFPAQSLPAKLNQHWHRFGKRWRVPRSGRVVEALVCAVLEQKVTGIESRRAWTALLSTFGERAPGPTPRSLRVFPEVSVIAAVPSWTWHSWGVQPAQSATIMRITNVAHRLEECTGLTLDAARRRLASVEGVGRWTVAEVSFRALGDPDAVSFGDFHLAAQLAYAFTGAMDGDDDQMADLLAPFAGHRHRVQRLVETSPIKRPSRGPRMTIPEHRSR